MSRDFIPADEWDEDYDDYDDDCDDCCCRRNHSTRKCRYIFAGLLIFFMWLVKRDKDRNKDNESKE